MGACHACDFIDIWMGDITQKHFDTNPVSNIHFLIYRDDAWDILVLGNQGKRILEYHPNILRGNLTWTVDCEKEGGYLDLCFMIVNGKKEWRNYIKSPLIYVGPYSCHDPAVMGAIVKGVSLRLRINSSKDEFFENSVEEAARAFEISGYNYQKTKQELLKFKNLDPIEPIKKVVRAATKKGAKAFYITNFDPRMLHPRRLISRNYHHMEANPLLVNLFPRENLIGSTRRMKNLSELLPPTIQIGGGGADQGHDAGDGGR